MRAHDGYILDIFLVLGHLGYILEILGNHVILGNFGKEHLVEKVNKQTKFVT